MQPIINLFFRKKNVCFSSIEVLFEVIISKFDKTIKYKRIEVPAFNKMPFGIIRNIYYAMRNSTTVNHITGDIHYIALGLPSKNTILTIHDIESLYFNKKGIKRKLIKLLWLTLPLKKVKYITVISEQTKKKILEEVKIDATKIKIIYNPVFPHFTYSPKTLNKEKPVILHVGTTANKNLEGLIEAINGINCELIILGRLNEKQINLLNKKEIFYSSYFNLSNDEVADLYKRCDLVFFASFYEGFGLPIIEAQSTGRPVITSNLSSMPEIAGEAAILVNPYNISEIKNAILELISNEAFRNNLIHKGLKNVERFKSEQIAMQYEALYNEVISNVTKS